MQAVMSAAASSLLFEMNNANILALLNGVVVSDQLMLRLVRRLNTLWKL